MQNDSQIMRLRYVQARNHLLVVISAGDRKSLLVTGSQAAVIQEQKCRRRSKANNHLLT